MTTTAPHPGTTAAMSPCELAAKDIAVKKRKDARNPGFLAAIVSSTAPVATLQPCPWVKKGVLQDFSKVSQIDADVESGVYLAPQPRAEANS